MALNGDVACGARNGRLRHRGLGCLSKSGPGAAFLGTMVLEPDLRKNKHVISMSLVHAQWGRPDPGLSDN